MKPSQFELARLMYRRYDARSVALSMAANGYFDEEPLVVVPVDAAFAKTLFSGSEDFATLVLDYVTRGGEFLVVEGNRRLSAVKLLLDPEMRERVKVPVSFPIVTDESIARDLNDIPCVVYPDRVEVIPYLGVKHIRGPLRWEAYSQAAYTAKIIDEAVNRDRDADAALDQLERQTGTTTTRLKRLYIAYKIFQQLDQDIEIDRDAVIERFSFVATMYAQIPLRAFLGLKAPSDIFLKERLITEGYLENAQLLFDWVFGNKEKKLQPVVMESRDLTGRLSVVVKSPEAIDYLREYRDLGGAYDRTNGELDFLTKRLQRAVSTVQQVMQVAYKYETDERLIAKAEELESAVIALRRQLR